MMRDRKPRSCFGNIVRLSSVPWTSQMRTPRSSSERYVSFVSL